MYKLVLAAVVCALVLLDAGFGCGGPNRPEPEDTGAATDGAP